ncbi:MAG: dihydroorotase [candidate division WOR-3 bacterium]|nr:MAG: dihydroorotase [candidate division WOR-3 bacterium]
MKPILIKGGRVIDPQTKCDDDLDLLITKNEISKIGKTIKQRDAYIIDAKGFVVCPGLIDLHTHLRDPGRPDEETIETGSKAAVAGGFTSICCMPNTDPAIDNEGIVNYIYKEAARVNLCRVFPIAAITKNREGRQITEFGELIRAGAKGFSDDGDAVANSSVLRHALEYSKIFDVPILEHPVDKDLAQDGLMNEGLTSTRLGMQGSPAIAEEIIVARDLLLAKFTGARLHFCHISSKNALELIRNAKKEGLRVTCETCPHYFVFNDQVLESFDTNYKVNPPIRTEEDRQAVIDGLRDGTIDCIATDHAPHCQAEKELEFASAPFGMIGLELAIPMIIMELIQKQRLSWIKVLKMLTTNPARIIGRKTGIIKEGGLADLTIIDPKKKWKPTESTIQSKSKNTPLLGKELVGRVVSVVVSGKIKYSLKD